MDGKTREKTKSATGLHSRNEKVLEIERGQY